MSAAQAAQALIARYFDAFNAGDSAAMLACVAATVRHDVNQGETREGKAAFEAFNAHMARCYREQLSEIVVMVSEEGDRAAAEFIVDGVYLADDEGLPPATGQTYRLPAGTFFTLENGLIARVTTYYNLKEWVRQVSGEA